MTLSPPTKGLLSMALEALLSLLFVSVFESEFTNAGVSDLIDTRGDSSSKAKLSDYVTSFENL